MVKQELGAEVKKWRIASKMTQEELSEASTVTIRYLRSIEAGQKQASLTTIFKLSIALGITPEKLILPVWRKAKADLID